MIRICCSNRTEALLAAFVRNLKDERQSAGPLVPVQVVVPNRNVETYLRLGVARACGIAANLKVTFLRKLLAHVVEQALPGARIVDAQQIQSHLLALFHDDAFLALPELASVRDYLHAGGVERDAIDRRRCGLALQLGPLFEEYAASRAHMVKAWKTRTLHQKHLVFAATEIWQRALWLAIFGRDGRIARRSQAEGVTWLRIDELLAVAEAQLATEALGPRLHLFGASYMAPAYHRMLATLSRSIDIVLYTLNPCQEYWEDVETASEVRRRIAKTTPSSAQTADDPYRLLDPSENLPLRLWGRPGRENLRLLSDLDACDFEEHFARSEAPTLLARLQNDILDRVTRKVPDPALRADGSLQVLACPGVRRELEVVAAEIWRCLRTDPGLRCNELAVVVPESRKDVYLSQVTAVFNESHDLPHHVLDVPLQSGHRLGVAIELLLNLPTSSFSRKELVPILTHPSVMRRYPQARASDWLRLIDELGIVRGADGQDLAGSYLDHDAFTWDQGLSRLALGAFMSGSDGEAPANLDGKLFLPAEVAPEERQDALGMALLVRSLIADARFAAGIGGPAERPFGQWLNFIRGMLTAYLIPEDDAEETLLGRCHAALDELEELGLKDLSVGYRVAAELARQALLSLTGARGQYLARGVTVASFVPMRAIPFRTVFVLGLGQGDFPSSRRRGDLDLREAKREPGDVTPREQDLYMFLETLLCTRERLVLSYVGRDEVTGEKRPPSSILLELREILASGYLPAPEVEKLFDDESNRPPLRRYRDTQRLDALPLAAAEHAAELLGISLRQAGAPTCIADLRRTLSPAAFSQVAGRLSLPVLPVPPARELPSKVVVALADLRAFLEDPLQASARFALRLREPQGDEELADREDEPFATEAWHRTRCLREAITRAVLASDVVPSAEAVAACYRAISLREELAGRGPAGLFREAEAGGHAHILDQWRDQLERVAEGGLLHGDLVHFGRAAENVHARAILPAIEIQIPTGKPGRPLRIEIQGKTSVLTQASGHPRGSIIFVGRGKDGKEEIRREKELLPAFLDHVALAAAGLSDAAGHRALLLLSHVDAIVDRRFAPLDAARARAYLGRLVADLMTGTFGLFKQPTGLHAYALPCEAVFASRRDGISITQAVEQLRDKHSETLRGHFSTLYGPIRNAVWRWGPPPIEEAAHMAEERFGLFFELLEAESE